MVSLEKKRILVTGYSSGIGQAFCSLPEIMEKYAFLFVGRTKPDLMREDDQYVSWDFNEEKPSDPIASPNQKLHALVLHHGFLAGKDFREISEAEILRTVNVNLLSILRLVRAYLSSLENGATLITFSSISAGKGSYDDVYALSKGGLEALSNSLSQKLGPLGVRVICVAPGLVSDTRMTSELKPGLFKETIKKIPLGHAADRFAIAKLSRDLLLNQKLSISGGVIHINGGQYLE